MEYSLGIRNFPYTNRFSQYSCVGFVPNRIRNRKVGKSGRLLFVFSSLTAASGTLAKTLLPCTIDDHIRKHVEKFARGSMLHLLDKHDQIQ